MKGSGVSRPVVVTGGAGFIGSNLVDRLARDGRHVIVFDSLRRPGVEENLAWLTRRHGQSVTANVADIRDAAAVSDAVKGADCVFHLAAQVAVTKSLDDPCEDFDINVRGTVNVLEAARRNGAPVIFASSNKVYGDLSGIPLAAGLEAYRPENGNIRRLGVSETQPLDFRTPYGCSKGAADQYVLDYARSYGLPVAVMRMSCVYGPRQFGTEDQGWVAHFLIRALKGEPIIVYGDGRQVRDVLYVDDAVEAYVRAWRRIRDLPQRVFNLGGGPENAVTLLAVLDRIGALLDRPPEVRFAPWRAGDQRYYVSDTRRARVALELGAPVPWRVGLARLAAWLAQGTPAKRRTVAKTRLPRVEARV